MLSSRQDRVEQKDRLNSKMKTLLPGTDNTYNLGSSNEAWRDLYLAGNINLTDTSLGGGSTIQTTGGALTLTAASNTAGSLLGNITLTADYNIPLSAGNNISLDADGTISLESDGILTIEGVNGFTSPNTPCFSVYNSATDSFSNASSSFHTVDFDTETFDVGSNFASDTFTAPVAGKYFFTAGVTVYNQEIAYWVYPEIHTDGGSFGSWGWQHSSGGDYTTHTLSCLVHLSSTQEAIVRIKAEADGGLNLFNILGGASNTYFQGYRVA